MDAIQALRRNLLFRDVPDPILKLVAECIEEESVPSGDTIVDETDHVGAIYLIRNGTVRFLRGGAPTQIVMFSGESFGEVPFLDGGPMELTAQAVENTELFVLRAERVRAKLAGNHEAGHALFRALTKVLAGRLRWSEETLFFFEADRAPR
jgi:CRP-like cAMP-binding protein